MSKGSLAGHRGLVVEDDYFIASDLKEELVGAGATVIGPVPSVEAALDLLVEDKPDAAILDVNLLDEKVFPVADALTSDGVPFCFMSGYDRRGMPERYATACWLQKPLGRPKLMSELRRLLDRAA
jgi:two-component SAPR family response regulator